MALAHAASDQVEGANNCDDLLGQHWCLMTEWAKHCDDPKRAGENVAIACTRVALELYY